MGQFYEAVEVKTLSYIEQSQDVGDARVIGDLQEDLQTGRNQPKREAGSKAEGMDLFKPFDIRHEGMGFEVCPTVFQHCFALVYFSKRKGDHLSPFWNDNMFCTIVCWKYVA